MFIDSFPLNSLRCVSIDSKIGLIRLNTKGGISTILLIEAKEGNFIGISYFLSLFQGKIRLDKWMLTMAI